MVFVISLITTALVVLCITTVLTLILDFGSKVRIGLIKSKFVSYFRPEYLNVIYIYIILYLFSINTIPTTICGILAFVIMSYSQNFL